MGDPSTTTIEQANDRLRERCASLRKRLAQVTERQASVLREVHAMKTAYTATPDVIERVEFLAYCDKWLSLTLGQIANQIEEKLVGEQPVQSPKGRR